MSETAAPTSLDYATPAAPGNALTQTLALLVDAYRDLQSRKLFWLTLILSFIVAGVFAFVGIDDQGVTIWGKHLRGLPFNSNLISPADFYKMLFTLWAIPIWLGFLATILALVAVGGIFPDAISTGSIDLYLSRPIGRLRLFLTKYCFGLLFTALQVLVFCIVSFFVIGVRSGDWEFGMFLAVPLVTLFFSYLYCVCVLVGIVTRSTLAAILLTALFWAFLFVVHTADVALLPFVAASDQRVMEQQRLVDADQALIDTNLQLPPEKRSNMSAFEYQRNIQKQQIADFQQTSQELHWWHDTVLDVSAPLPKTSETVALMSRYLVRPTAMQAVEQERRERNERFRQERGGPATQPRQGMAKFLDTPQVQQQVRDELSARDLPWIAGTSLGFEAAILALAAWVFCRRDY